MPEVFYPKLSYEIVGALFEVYNNLNYGHREKIYQKAIAEELKRRKINFIKEVHFPIKYKDQNIARYFFDFLIENKIILELKVAEDFYQKDVNQILSYLKYQNYRLGILAIFSKEGLKFRRILN